MNKYIEHVIDSLIRENKDSINKQYYCEVQQVSEKETKELLTSLYHHDEKFKEIFKDYLQELIDERIGVVQAEDNYHSGLIPKIDSINGEITWGKIA